MSKETNTKKEFVDFIKSNNTKELIIWKCCLTVFFFLMLGVCIFLQVYFKKFGDGWRQYEPETHTKGWMIAVQFHNADCDSGWNTRVIINATVNTLLILLIGSGTWLFCKNRILFSAINLWLGAYVFAWGATLFDGCVVNYFAKWKPIGESVISFWEFYCLSDFVLYIGLGGFALTAIIWFIYKIVKEIKQNKKSK